MCGIPQKNFTEENKKMTTHQGTVFSSKSKERKEDAGLTPQEHDLAEQESEVKLNVSELEENGRLRQNIKWITFLRCLSLHFQQLGGKNPVNHCSGAVGHLS